MAKPISKMPDEPMPMGDMVIADGTPRERTESFLVNLLLNFDPTYAVEVTRADESEIFVDIYGGDPGKIIGRGGRTLARPGARLRARWPAARAEARRRRVLRRLCARGVLGEARHALQHAHAASVAVAPRGTVRRRVEEAALERVNDPAAVSEDRQGDRRAAHVEEVGAQLAQGLIDGLVSVTHLLEDGGVAEEVLLRERDAHHPRHAR